VFDCMCNTQKFFVTLRLWECRCGRVKKFAMPLSLESSNQSLVKSWTWIHDDLPKLSGMSHLTTPYNNWEGFFSYYRWYPIRNCSPVHDSRIDSSYNRKSQPIAIRSQRPYYCGARIKENLLACIWNVGKAWSFSL